MVLPTLFDYLGESFSYKEVHFKPFCPPGKTSCSSAENGNETLTINFYLLGVLVTL